MNVFRVFLASPSDLEAERKKANEIVDRLNRIIRRVDWTIELLGWEDRLPGFGRPQGQINDDVDVCDLFVGIIWRRWGSPSGKFQSGFEEEFERAIMRRRQSGSPEIWLYFKRVEDTSDPGEQLRRVLAFRNKIEQQHELLFAKFGDTGEWATVFYDALLEYVLKHASPREIPRIQSAAITTAPPRGDAMQTRLDDAKHEVPEQLRRVSEAIGDAARGSGTAQFDAQLLALGEVDLVRLHFLGAALMYEAVIQDTLSNHAANCVYRHRDALGSLTGVERWLALTSMLREGNRNVPGWYWVRNMSDERIAQLLVSVVTDHPDEEVRTSTLNMLSSQPYLPGMTRMNELVGAALDQPSDEMRSAALNYADRFGDNKTADIIGSRVRGMSDELQRKAVVAIGRILMRQDPNLALDRLLKTSREPNGRLLTLIRETGDALDDTKLRRLLGHKSSDLRAMAADNLARKDLLTAEDAKSLLSDSETRVRAIGIRRLIVLGEPPTAGNIRELLADDSKEKPKTFAGLLSGARNAPRPDDLVEELFSTLSYDELIRLVNWFVIDGHVAYKVLGLNHFGRFGERVRKDLADRFATFHEQEKQRLKATLVKKIQPQSGDWLESGASDVANTALEAGVEKVLEEWADLDNFITTGFVRAALAALAKNGSAKDLQIARQHLDSEDPASRKAALDMVSRFGDDSDVDSLLALAVREYGDIAERAARAALTLSTDRWLRAMQYLEREARPFLHVGIEELSAHSEFPSKWPELLPYLAVDNESVRLATVKLLCSRLESVDLIKLLNRLLQADTYYYDVVTTLDRSIYGPKAWRST